VRGPVDGKKVKTNLALAAILAAATRCACARTALGDVGLLLRRYRGRKVVLAHAVAIVVVH
jgi:hypothetical protein